MADFVFFHLDSSNCIPWDCFEQNLDYAFAFNPSSCGKYPFDSCQTNEVFVASLSSTHSSKEILHAAFEFGPAFLEHIGVSTGLIWNKKSGEFCLFRDPFGFIPLYVIQFPEAKNRANRLFTTSPDLYRNIVCNRTINDAWFDRFIECRHGDSCDDVYVDTQRIRPGEVYFQTKNDKDAFFESLRGNPCLKSCEWTCSTSSIWTHRYDEVLDLSYQEAVKKLREQLIDAASRIPCSEPCFTLSGGLDSSGILAAWCESHEGVFDAVSLVSRRFESCDESKELDVLEKRFPIRLHRIVMDDAWPLCEPELYQNTIGIGPVCSPGIESNLVAYRGIEKVLGSRMLITGYGGNFIVKARMEAVFRDLLERRALMELFEELKNCSQSRRFARRVLGNIAQGKIRASWRKLKNKRDELNLEKPRTWLNNRMKAQFSEEMYDRVFGMTHLEERSWTPLSWGWEYAVRAMDSASRLTGHRFYDPLHDLSLCDFCAKLPPRYFLKNGEYRPVYRDALSSLLPDEITYHPKVQSFDELMIEGLCRRARSLIETAIAGKKSGYFFDISRLEEAFERYCSESLTGEPSDSMFYLWRSLTTSLWLNAVKD